MSENLIENLKNAVRDIPDFPKKGIIFKDITTLLQNGKLFKDSVDVLAEKFFDKRITVVAAIESRGFIFGAPLAYKLGVGLVPLRKKGKLPYKTVSTTYQLEYGTDTLEIHEDAVRAGDNVLLIDDLLATGGTAGAAVDLIRKMGANVVCTAFLIELLFLEGRKRIKDCAIISLIQY